SPLDSGRYHSPRGDRPTSGWRKRLPPQHLGSIWRIRIWHDNKGLSPSWYLQHVIVRDLQSSKSYFFLVNDWLSVESEENDGMVEKEVYAASECSLRSFSRIFIAELQRGFFEKHVWLSMWDRPPRSRFTRVQRATCCSLLIFLFLCANAVWYGMVGNVHLSNGAVSNLIPVNVDTVAVGLVSSVVVYPLYLVILFLFRMARGKVMRRKSYRLPRWAAWVRVLPCADTGPPTTVSARTDALKCFWQTRVGGESPSPSSLTCISAQACPGC
uniref:Polycystin 1, transient receptor potential channel interacting n=1 Tax=Strix occidentalis caurina TaxID=311401 RepID=A0A8D0FSD2_STROC